MRVCWRWFKYTHGSKARRLIQIIRKCIESSACMVGLWSDISKQEQPPVRPLIRMSSTSKGTESSACVCGTTCFRGKWTDSKHSITCMQNIEFGQKQRQVISRSNNVSPSYYLLLYQTKLFLSMPENQVKSQMISLQRSVIQDCGRLALYAQITVKIVKRICGENFFGR